MRDKTGISLITIVRDGGKTIEETLASVLRQTVCPAEHIIVDGESADNTLELCYSYSNRAPYPVRILSRPPAGVYDALNVGIEGAGAGVVGVLHAGDRLASADVLESYTEKFSAMPDIGILYADIVYLKKDGSRGRYYSGELFSPRSLKQGFMFPHPSMYVRRSLYDKYGLYATDYKIAGDFEWIVRTVLKAGEQALYLEKCVVEMAPGGLSSRLSSRLSVTPVEKMRALRANGFSASPLRMAGRYFYALQTIKNRKR